MQHLRLPIVLWVLAAISLTAATAQREFETTPEAVAKCLASLDTWIIAQPKAVRPLPGVSFDLNKCKGITLSGADVSQSDLAQRAAELIANASGVRLPVIKGHPTGRTIKLELLATPAQFVNVPAGPIASRRWRAPRAPGSS